ncbi:MAG TPA: class I SAM-dependent methyltransferase [Pirellulales bacterium]|nr:class I SAM-dependent methyltransferase [Pirellulales bacterium]
MATIHGTDKWNSHWYAQHYQRHFQPLRRKRLNLLEIGIGGYDDPFDGGGSLRMWKQFFPRAKIYGIDIHEKSAHAEPRVAVFRGSQCDPDFLHKVARQIGRIDIIIDDGSHVNEHAIASFECLFPLLADGGIYAIEDTQTSYWPGSYGGSTDLSCASTTMNRLKRLVDGLNYREFLDPHYSPSYFDRHVVSAHFYHNLAFIYKGDNEENTNRERFVGPPSNAIALQDVR